MKKTVRFFGAALAFLALLLLILWPLQALFIRKSLGLPWDMSNKVSGFYNEEEDQFQVMFFGSSHSYASFSPLELWEETGIKSYVFSTQQQPLWATYTYMEEAFQTQSPTLVVLDCLMALGEQEFYDEGVNHSYMDDIPLSWNKVELAGQSVPDLEGRLSLVFPFIKYHGRWSELNRSDFTFRRSQVRDPYKGFLVLSDQGTEYPQPEDFFTPGPDAPLLEKNQYWLEQIIRLCQEEGVALWLVKAPSNLDGAEKARLNTVEEIAAQHGVPFRDFNEEYGAIGLDGSCFHDEHHLDVGGASLFTRYFENILLEQYPGLRQEPEDEQWRADLAVYEQAKAAALGS